MSGGVTARTGGHLKGAQEVPAALVEHLPHQTLEFEVI